MTITVAVTVPRSRRDASVGKFRREWLGGKIKKFESPAPAKSTQVYVLYREWCARMGYPRYAPEPQFLAELAKRSGVVKRQAHYLNGSGPCVAAFIFPPGIERPPEKSQQAWLGECVQDFDKRLKALARIAM